MSGRQRLGFTVASLVLAIAALISIYTVVLQKNYAQNTEEAAMSRDIQCADAIHRLVSGKFTRTDFETLTTLEDMDDPRYQELQQEPSSAERDAALRAVEYQQDRLSRVRAARRETSESDLHIILTHHPLSEESLADLQALTRTDNDSYVRTIALVLAGHYVSGQWRIPGICPVRVPESAGLGNNGWFPPDSAVTQARTDCPSPLACSTLRSSACTCSSVNVSKGAARRMDASPWPRSCI